MPRHDRSTGPVLTPASAHPVLDPVTQQFVDERLDRAPGPLRDQSLAVIRQAFAEAQAPQSDLPDVEILDLALHSGDGERLPIRILRPPGRAEPLPVVLHLHGGGWIMGGHGAHERLTRRLALGVGAAVVQVDYALAPEARHPAQIEQAHAALLAVVERAASLNLDAGRIAVAGDGAGGAIAAALALRVALAEGPALAGQVLLCPITAPVGQSPSSLAFAEGPGPTADDLRYCEACLGATPDDDTPAFVLDTPLRRLSTLPPTLVITAEADVTRDDAEAYARKLMRAGVEVTAQRMVGAIHDFMVLEALRDTPPTRAAMRQTIDFLREVLEIER
ncbi:alpha/beta hydrolase [Caulobacter endophyticus]|uniref:alpha/beta hydrolase n=1 Tax=Caulobacter endophyticus TaxID=2172652 RepID=UPI00240EC2BB|nr:alpha/beta hydrolase [Caulobacter endophyticus]MDG2528956.1 alpha/beta hydrolase [Caulobacter endophyticus]